MYDTSLKRKWDAAGALEYARREGIEKGTREGIEKGIRKGIRKGIEKAQAEAYAEKLESAREMKKYGISDEQIARFTKLPIEVIEKL